LRREKGHDIAAACGQLRLQTSRAERRSGFSLIHRSQCSHRPVAGPRLKLEQGQIIGRPAGPWLQTKLSAAVFQFLILPSYFFVRLGSGFHSDFCNFGVGRSPRRSPSTAEASWTLSVERLLLACFPSDFAFNSRTKEQRAGHANNSRSRIFKAMRKSSSHHATSPVLRGGLMSWSFLPGMAPRQQSAVLFNMVRMFMLLPPSIKRSLAASRFLGSRNRMEQPPICCKVSRTNSAAI